MALPARTVKSGGIALKYGALSSLIPASVYLILQLLDLLIHNLDQTGRYIGNIVPVAPLFAVGLYRFVLADVVYSCYEGILFGIVVAIAAGVSGRWAAEQSGKVSTALLQGLWVGCGFGILAFLINIALYLIRYGGPLGDTFNQIVTGKDQFGYGQTYLWYLLVYFLLSYYLITSLLAIPCGILGGWLGCKWLHKPPLAVSGTAPTSTSSSI